MAERDPKVPPQEILDTSFNPLCNVVAHAHPEAVLGIWYLWPDGQPILFHLGAASLLVLRCNLQTLVSSL